MLLAGPYGLFDAMNLKIYLAAVLSGQTGTILQDWGIDAGDVFMVGIYFTNMAYRILMLLVHRHSCILQM